MERWSKLDSPTILTECALRLLARGLDGRFDAAGSGVMLGDAMALTAKHVIEDHMSVLDGRSLASGMTARFELIAARGLRDGKTMVIYIVEAFSLSPVSDLAVLTLRPRGPVPAAALPVLDLFPPGVGEPIVGVGFHSGTAAVVNEVVRVNHEAHTSAGHVIEVHHQLRDPSRLTFPCFRVDARFDGGMSGGPVFDQRGRVCGIVCSSAPPHESGEAHLSYATTLWPLMSLAVPGTDGSARVVRDLAASGEIAAENWQNTELVRDGDAVGCVAHIPAER